MYAIYKKSNIKSRDDIVVKMLSELSFQKLDSFSRGQIYYNCNDDDKCQGNSRCVSKVHFKNMVINQEFCVCDTEHTGLSGQFCEFNERYGVSTRDFIDNFGEAGSIDSFSEAEMTKNFVMAMSIELVSNSWLDFAI